MEVAAKDFFLLLVLGIFEGQDEDDGKGICVTPNRSRPNACPNV